MLVEQEFFTETGADLCHLINARWYDEEIGRFVEVDPGKDGQNWYVYCQNNPLAYTDSDGKVGNPVVDELQSKFGLGFAKGLWNTAKSTYTGIKNLVSDPVKVVTDTAKGVAYVATHLEQTYTATKNATVKKLQEIGKADLFTKAEMIGEVTGRVGGELGLAIAGTKGVDKLKNLGTVSKLTEAADVIDSTTDISKITKAVDTIQDASKLTQTTKLVRSTLPELTGSTAEAFEGPARLRTFEAGERIYRTPGCLGEPVDAPGSWFGTRETVTKKGTESLYNVVKWDNPLDKQVTYEFTQDVTLYYGKVAGGNGYQALFPKDIVPGDVLKYISEKPLK
jgi:RHS repeat-associated protein